MRHAMGVLLGVSVGACSAVEPGGQASKEVPKAQETKQAAPQPLVEQAVTASVPPTTEAEPNLETETPEQLAEMEAADREYEAALAERKAQEQPVKSLENFRVKGFWLGMPMAEAESVKANLLQENGTPDAGALIELEGKDGKLESFNFAAGGGVDAFFHAEALPPEQFAQEFTVAYAEYVPMMELVEAGPNGELFHGSAWMHYDSSLGFKATVKVIMHSGLSRARMSLKIETARSLSMM